MDVVPPKLPPRPTWMSDDEYRKLLQAERRMLSDLERSSTLKGFFRNWFRDVWR